MGVKKVNSIEMECPYCHNNTADVYEVAGPKGKTTILACQKCQNVLDKKFETNPEFTHYSFLDRVHCPFCNSSDCKKISDVSKAASAAVFGVFALGKVTKTWHCNSCGSNFG